MNKCVRRYVIRKIAIWFGNFIVALAVTCSILFLCVWLSEQGPWLVTTGLIIGVGFVAVVIIGSAIGAVVELIAEARRECGE